MSMISHLNTGVTHIRTQFNSPAHANLVSVPKFEQEQLAEFLKMVPHISDLSHQSLFRVEWSEDEGERTATVKLANESKRKTTTPITLRFTNPTQTNSEGHDAGSLPVQNNAALAALAYWTGQAAPDCYENLCKAIHAFQDTYTRPEIIPEPMPKPYAV